MNTKLENWIRLSTLVLLVYAYAMSTPSLAHDAHDHEDDQHVDAHHLQVPNELATELVEKYRLTGDDHVLDDAWTAIDGETLNASSDAEQLVLGATIAQARHDFAHAKTLLSYATNGRPNYDAAWLLQASVDLIGGHTTSARKACQRLRAMPVVIGMTCLARVDVAEGRFKHAHRKMDAVIDALESRSLPANMKAWVHSVAGDAAAPYHAAEAEDHYRASLQLEERAQVRAALADLLINADQLAEAKAVLDVESESLALAVRRLIVQRSTSTTASNKDEVMKFDHVFHHWIEDDDWAHAREMARFYLDVLPEPCLAKRLADINIEIQKESEDQQLVERTSGYQSCAN